MENNWIYLPDGGYPERAGTVIVLILTRSRDPHHDKGKDGIIEIATAYYSEFYGHRHWDEIVVEGTKFEIIDEYACFEDYEDIRTEHQDISSDTYIAAWQPMPAPPEDIPWPPRKPVSRWVKTSECPKCRYAPDPALNPDDLNYCPRCGAQMHQTYVIDPNEADLH